MAASFLHLCPGRLRNCCTCLPVLGLIAEHLTAFRAPQLVTERRRTANLVEDLKRSKEENFLAVSMLKSLFAEVHIQAASSIANAVLRHSEIVACSLPSMLVVATCVQQQRAEQEEEFITNRLTKRLTQLKREKQNLANEVTRCLALLPAAVQFGSALESARCIQMPV